MRLGGAIRAEIAKLLTTRLWWILLIIMVGYVGFTAAIIAAAFGGALPGGTGDEQMMMPTTGLHALVYSVTTTIGYVFPVILGTLAITGEYRHQTLTPTFLSIPRRGVVLVAKLITLFFFGAICGIAALIGSVGAGAPILALQGIDTGLGDGDTWLMLARVVLAMGLWAVVGVGVGSLIPSQITAIIVLLAFTQFVEPTLRAVAMFVEGAATVGRFLPGAAGDALVGSSIFTALGTSAGADATLLWWQGGLVLFGLALVLSVVGYLVTWRRDVA